MSKPKRKTLSILRVAAYFLILGIHTPSFGSDYSEKNSEKDSWFYTQLSEAEEKLKSAIEDAVDNAFEDSMYELLGQGIAEKFGEQFSESLSGIISIGPFLSVTDLLGSGGATESQVMMKALLQAIEEAKEDIILSVEQQYQDETEARLNAIIRNLDIYNARSTEYRKTSYSTLNDLINDANYVLERIEQKDDKYADNLHRYITLSGLQIQMQKEYTRWLVLDTNPSADEQHIDSETEAVLTPQVAYANSFLSISSAGTINFWKQAFKDEFSAQIEFDGRIPSNGFPFIDGVTNRKKSGKRPGQTYDATDKSNSGFYTYRMGEGKVRFKAIMEECVGTRTVSLVFHIFDASNKYTGKASKFYSNGIGKCTQVNNNPLTSLPDTVANSAAVRDAIKNHQNDTEAFLQYADEGLSPIVDILDQWWELTSNGQRPKSEIEEYIDANL